MNSSTGFTEGDSGAGAVVLVMLTFQFSIAKKMERLIHCLFLVLDLTSCLMVISSVGQPGGGSSDSVMTG